MLGQTGKVQEASPGACEEVVIGEPEHAAHSLTGEAGGCGHFPDAAEAERGIAAGR